MHICWGAQAALYHHYGVPKYPVPAKVFGLFPHRVLDPHEPIMRGFDEIFMAPHSRHTEVREGDILKVKSLKLAAVSEEAGVYMAVSTDGRMIFVTGHPEYDRLTLKAEYDRDVSKGLPIAVPKNYFPGDDPRREPAGDVEVARAPPVFQLAELLRLPGHALRPGKAAGDRHARSRRSSRPRRTAAAATRRPAPGRRSAPRCVSRRHDEEILVPRPVEQP